MTSPFGREDVDLARAQVEPQRVEELLGLLGLALPVEQLAQPAHLVGDRGRLGDRGVALSLYFQCAAMPYSAVRCMAWVRICSSTGLPPGPMTVVCSDWYMLNLGIAM